MSKPAKTKENLKKCICMTCPSYTLVCKMKNMLKNIMVMMRGISKKDHFEGFYCAFEKSNCITDKKGCVCATCEVYKENNLGKLYFCTTTDSE